MVVWAAALPVIAKAIGAGLGAGSSALSLFGSGGSSGSAKTAFHRQKEMMNLQYLYQTALADKQFEQNKYFTENAHQAEVSDLRAAGLNPILSANNGATSSVSMGSAGVLDGANSLSSAAAYENAKTQKMLSGIEAIQGLSNATLNASAAKLNEEKAKTEQFEQVSKDIANRISLIDEKMKSEDWKYYPNTVKKNYETLVKNLEFLQEQISYYKVLQVVEPIKAGAASTSAKAAMIEATSGNPYKMLNDLIRGFSGGSVGDLAKMFADIKNKNSGNNTYW